MNLELIATAIDGVQGESQINAHGADGRLVP